MAVYAMQLLTDLDEFADEFYAKTGYKDQVQIRLNS